jgi:hypothetical protein
MFIHFAFGSLGRENKIGEQTENVINLILKEKRLRVNKCTEFIPRYPKPGTKRIPIDKMNVESEGSVTRLTYNIDLTKPHELPNDNTIYYQQRNVNMICFARRNFSQLKKSTLPKEYGKFGIVLKKEFLESNGIRPVRYYTEEEVWSDTLIKKWNYELKSLSKEEQRDCEKQILTYRKPATYFPAFKKSVMARVGGREVEYIKYDRYEEGYDFRQEHEFRIAFEEGVEYLNFEEGDLFMVITPDSESYNRVKTFSECNWSKQPEVRVFPS